jgi:ribosomal protein S18 acetylase RimI-like enzyme
MSITRTDSPLSPMHEPEALQAESSAPGARVPPVPERSDGRTWSWVPIRSLGPRHRERIAAHLLALDQRSRYLRFGYAATDAQISRYVDTLDFAQDEVFGIFNRRLELIAMAHLAHRGADAQRRHAAMSEFGVSVLPKARRRGFGSRLFEHAMLHAKNRGVETLFIHALSENTAMLRIARSAGATIERDGPESEAWVKLPPDSLASHLDELLGEQAAEFDYRLKRRAHRVEQLLKPRTKSPTQDDSSFDV